MSVASSSAGRRRKADPALSRRLVHAADKGDHREVFRVVLTHASRTSGKRDVKYDVNFRDVDDGQTALMKATKRGLFDIVRLLVERNLSRFGHRHDEGQIEVALQDNSGRTAAMLAAQEGHLTILEYLVEHPRFSVKDKANMLARDLDGWTPLMLAAHRGHWPIVRYLLRRGVSPLDTDRKNCSPLFLAASAGHVATVRVICEHFLEDQGLDPAAIEQMREDAERAGDGKELFRVPQIQVTHGRRNALLEVRDSEGRTPLFAAAHYGRLYCVEYLASQGAKYELLDEETDSLRHVKDEPLDLSARNRGLTERTVYQAVFLGRTRKLNAERMENYVKDLTKKMDSEAKVTMQKVALQRSLAEASFLRTLKANTFLMSATQARDTLRQPEMAFRLCCRGLSYTKPNDKRMVMALERQVREELVRVADDMVPLMRCRQQYLESVEMLESHQAAIKTMGQNSDREVDWHERPLTQKTILLAARCATYDDDDIENGVPINRRLTAEMKDRFLSSLKEDKKRVENEALKLLDKETEFRDLEKEHKALKRFFSTLSKVTEDRAANSNASDEERKTNMDAHKAFLDNNDWFDTVLADLDKGNASLLRGDDGILDDEAQDWLDEELSRRERKPKPAEPLRPGDEGYRYDKSQSGGKRVCGVEPDSCTIS